MRLSRLHINGFKSFPDRAELGFDDGVTAIVGPNGCGKSNVVDAITWVLGEQSAKSLRGERMEDVIFNGSDARKPTATAEVRLKLADVAQAAMPAAMEPDQLLDEQPLVTRDIEIGRRLYRSGESEYLIDGEVCRLRDIHDLLMDSGLGVKAYAVIEQGKIGQILSSRPAERRMLIEEAAGVTKYKSRRRSAELKLDAAQLNLTRIDDIIFEVEKQRGALRRQAARARRYKRLREELRRWEQVLFAHRHEALSQEIERAESRLADVRARETAAAGHVAELEAALETLRLEMTQAESGAMATREETHRHELEIGRRQQQIQFDRHQIEDLGKRADELDVEVRELDGRRAPLQFEIETQRAGARQARQSLDAAGERVDACEADYSRAQSAVQGAEHEADETRAAVLASGTTLSALRQARDNAAAVRDRVAAERSRLDVEARDLENEAERARRDLAGAARALGTARDALEAATRLRGELEGTLADRRVRRQQQSETLAGRQRDLAGQEARLWSLEELEARRASFGDAARFLLEAASPDIRQHGAVADHLDVERSYERAVDALLGDLLQHVIVETNDHVKAALAQLASANAGRCGFVVLEDAARAPHIPAPAAAAEPARALRDVVRAKGPHAVAVMSLIGDALIVGTFDDAKRLARTVAVPVGTINGEVFRGASLVEGGSRQDVRGILEMRGDIGRLRDEVKATDLDVHRVANEVFSLDLLIDQSEIDLAGCLETQHQQDKIIVGLEGQMGHAEAEMARLARRLDVVATEQRRAAEEERAADERREDAAAAIADHERHQVGAEGRLGDVMVRLQAAREDAEARMRKVTEARTEQAGLAERTAALDSDVARLEETSRDLESRLASRRSEIARTETRRTELHEAIRETERLLDENIREIEELKQQMRGLDENFVELRSRFGVREHDIRAARHAVETIRADVTRYEVARATAAADLSHLAAVCLEAVNASIDDVVAEVARMELDGDLVAAGKRLAAISVPDVDEVDSMTDVGAGFSPPDSEPADAGSDVSTEPTTPEEIIADLRRKIERLGPVNMMAIEQFDELEARHTFLTTQRKDLLDSIAQTGEAIRKIDKTTRERFQEAFVSINANFEQTFMTLFGGGRAGLVLIDQEDETESGIDIIAQPPGKRLQNVQLLSGGEKALTAMALMFAIFKHRPSPFCLLDEIDAPLDDANIGRFVEMLQGMQSHTQFILITHNRKTMEIANRLYGVTMEEPGVSKLISLQLN